jgi:exodeoxyribonuclease-5
MKPTDFHTAISLFNSSNLLSPIYKLDFEPGREQRDLIAHTLTSILAGERLCLFPGAAGTGKTTTLKLLLQVLTDCGHIVTNAAPTHKAAGRFQEALGAEFAERKVVTAHSIIYAGAEEIRETETDEDGNEIVAEFGDELAFNRREPGTAKVGTILVIDESSMIGKEFASDIWNAIPETTTIIAVGDPHQLPPVKDDAGFPLHEATVTLSKVYRQADQSAVLRAATDIRNKKVPFTYSRVDDFKAGQAILDRAGVRTPWMDSGQAGETLANMFRANGGDAAAIVGTHSTRVELNDATRYFLGFPRRNEGPQVGERLVCRAKGAGLNNSDIVEVVSVEHADFGPNFGDGWVLRVKNGREREVAVLRSTWDGQCAAKNRGLIPYSVQKNMEDYIAADIAKFGEKIYAKVAEKQDSWKARKTEEAPNWLVSIWTAQEARKHGAHALYLKQYLASLDSGYAVTCHAAQGSQYNEIIVVADMVDFVVDGQKGQTYRWSYTALTRAVKNAVVVRKSRNGWPQR